MNITNQYLSNSFPAFVFAGETNEDIAFVDKMVAAIEKNNGYCPCRPVKNEDTKCPCKEYREEGHCHCGLYKDKLVNLRTFKVTMKDGSTLTISAHNANEIIENYGFEDVKIESIQ